MLRFDLDFRSCVLEDIKRLLGERFALAVGIGLIMAALAAIMGLIDVLGDVQIRNLSDAWLHAGGNVVAVVIELYNWYSRYEQGTSAQGTSAVVPTGLILSFIYGFGKTEYPGAAYAATIHKSQGSEYPAVVIPVMT